MTTASTDRDDLDLDPGDPARRWLQTPHAGHVSALVWGHGPANVVLLHDVGGEAADWSGVVARVLGADPSVVVVAVDLPGHGRSSATTGPPPRPDRAALAVIDAVRSLAPRARLVGGRGYGAAVAVAAARRRPDVVQALALVDLEAGIDVEAVTVPVTIVEGGLGPLADAILGSVTQ